MLQGFERLDAEFIVYDDGFRGWTYRYAEIARERCLPFLAVKENADLSKKKTIFAQQGLLPSSSAGPIPIRSKAAFCLVPSVRQGK